MKTSPDLFELIQSLSRAEKRYIRIAAERHVVGGDHNGYMQLFDVIDSLDTYDEKQVRLLLEDAPFLPYLSRMKNYLYTFILRTLDTFHADSTTDHTLARLLHEHDILYDRGLYRHCRRILARAEKTALKHENFAVLLDIARRRQKPGLRAVERGGRRHGTDSAAQRTQLENFTNLVEYEMLEAQVVNLFATQGFLLTDEEIRPYGALLHHPLLENEQCALSRRALLHYHTIHAHIAHYTDNPAQAYHHTERLYHMYSALHEQGFTDADALLNALCNHAIVCRTLFRYAELRPLLHRMHTIPSSFGSRLARTRLSTVAITTGADLLLYDGRPAPIRDELQRIRSEQQFEADVHVPARALYTAKLAFSIGRCGDALDILNALTTSHSSLRPGVLLDIRLWTLLLHYELGNGAYLPYLTTSIRRTLRTHDSATAFTGTLLAFFDTVARHPPSRGDFRVLLKRLHDAVRQIDEEPSDTEQLILSWAESRTSGRSFLAIESARLRAAEHAAQQQEHRSA